jgi:hypothetical protein
MLRVAEYTLDPEDVTSARLLAIGIRPRARVRAIYASHCCAARVVGVAVERDGLP